jgi:hypothetical protein
MAADIELAPGAEWGDAHQVRANFGLNRSYLYDLDHAGLIHSKNIRRRGMQRGRRLFNIPSIRAYLDSLDDRPAKLWVNTRDGLRHREERRTARAVPNKSNNQIHEATPIGESS